MIPMHPLPFAGVSCKVLCNSSWRFLRDSLLSNCDFTFQFLHHMWIILVGIACQESPWEGNTWIYVWGLWWPRPSHRDHILNVFFTWILGKVQSHTYSVTPNTPTPVKYINKKAFKTVVSFLDDPVCALVF